MTDWFTKPEFQAWLAERLAERERQAPPPGVPAGSMGFAMAPPRSPGRWRACAVCLTDGCVHYVGWACAVCLMDGCVHGMAMVREYDDDLPF